MTTVVVVVVMKNGYHYPILLLVQVQWFRPFRPMVAVGMHPASPAPTSRVVSAASLEDSRCIELVVGLWRSWGRRWCRQRPVSARRHCGA